MSFLIRPWVVSVVVYAVATFVAGALIAGATQPGSAAASAWALLIGPPCLAVVAGVTGMRSPRRPSWRTGVAVALPVVAVAIALAATSAAHAGSALSPVAAVAAGAVPVAVALLSAAGCGMLASRMWTPAATAPFGYVTPAQEGAA